MTGRDKEIDAFDLMIARSKRRLHSRGMVISGLRGVGKTVLLNHFRAHAERMGWFTVSLEGISGPVGASAVREKLARELLIAGRKRFRRSPQEKLAKALGSISSFSASIGVSGIEFGIEKNAGRADSGMIEIDLEEMIEDLALALKAERSGIAFFIDEMQDLDESLLTALIATQHIAGQQEWPFYIIGAGLPNLPARLSEARSYAERLFDYRQIGPLDVAASEMALVEPAQKSGAQFAPEAVDILLDAANGYPYFLQEFGKAIWDIAPATPFMKSDAELAVKAGRRQLDSGFFPSRWERATRSERSYLRAMALDADSGSSTGALAERLGVSASKLGPARAAVIAKGLVYAPEHGYVAFTVPGMASFILRQQDDSR